MKKYISLSKYPGRVGEFFYNNFFKYYGVDAVYEPRGTNNLYQSLKTANLENVAGISISMPYKKEVLQHLNNVSAYCDIYNTCNTIKVDGNNLIGYNTDYYGMVEVCKHIPDDSRITILGDGAMANMFIKYLEYGHYGNLNICARKLNTWENRNISTDVIINCTGLGTSTSESPYQNLPSDVSTIIDLSLKDNILKKQSMDSTIKYISGQEFYKNQFLKQFEIYTGITSSIETFNKIERKLYETV